MHSLGVNEKEFDVVTMEKSCFVHHTIKSIYVKEDDQVVDVFLMGYGTMEALQQQQKVLSLNVPMRNDKVGSSLPFYIK